MTQTGAIFMNTAVVNLDFPAADQEVLPGVVWGAIEAFPTPAYWAYQVFARRLEANRINYKLGTTLKEEVGACLLGGHGIPASVGILAFKKLRDLGAFAEHAPSEDMLYAWLSEPIESGGKTIKYRFARQKARYLAAALEKLEVEVPPSDSGRGLRDWLLAIPGIGYKTASWIARNWLDADDVAILDIHILRAGLVGGFFPKTLTVERDYLKLEELFIEFSLALGVKPSELDALMWHEMMLSQKTVHEILEGHRGTPLSKLKATSPSRPKNRDTNPNQTLLMI